MFRPLVFSSFFACALLAPSLGQAKSTSFLINPRREMLVLSDGTPAQLRNNPNARDRTLQEVLDFIVDNDVNRTAYRLGQYVCTEYAVALHDQAEAAGIRCALVSLSFEEGIGHAYNAFQTTDCGLVYIDCTGSPDGDYDDRFDTIGFVEVGKPYGRLHIELAARWPSNYTKYEDAASIFRNLKAWDAEISREKTWISRTTRELQNRIDRSSPKERRNLVETAGALQRKVDLHNQKVAYRNQLANTFRLQYSENKSPVAHVDVFW
jgi:hypothetical protein